MSYEFREIIFTIRELAREIVAACDAYKSRVISADDLKSIISHYARQYPDKIFNGPDINPTVKLIAGKKRAAILYDILEEYQPSLFRGVKDK